MRALKARVYLWLVFMNWCVPKGSGYITGLVQVRHIGEKISKRAIDHITENSSLRDYNLFNRPYRVN